MGGAQPLAITMNEGVCLAAEIEEWRTHFHVPIFVKHYLKLLSTQDEIVRVLELLHRNRFTRQLEVETYTWNVLPKELQTDLQSSIGRELEWVLQKWNAINPVK